jgi:hypothetical protein
MDRINRAAATHIQRMEARIEQQNALIVELRQNGQDTIAATKHLVLLRNTLAEMRVQLCALAPTRMMANPLRRAG